MDFENISNFCVEVSDVEFVDANNHRFRVSATIDQIGKYTIHSGKIVFITKNCKCYVSPFAFEVEDVLKKSGFVEGAVMQPFSNHANPLNPSVAMRMYMLTEAKKRIDNEEIQNFESRHR